MFSLTSSCSAPGGSHSWSIHPSVEAFSSSSVASSSSLLYLGAGEGGNALVPGARYLVTQPDHPLFLITYPQYTQVFARVEPLYTQVFGRVKGS